MKASIYNHQNGRFIVLNSIDRPDYQSNKVKDKYRLSRKIFIRPNKESPSDTLDITGYKIDNLAGPIHGKLQSLFRTKLI